MSNYIQVKRFFCYIFVFFFVAVSAMAQITGEIVDEDGYAIPNASAIYKGHHVAVVSDINGKFSIERHEGWTLTFSSVGFKTQTLRHIYG